MKNQVLNVEQMKYLQKLGIDTSKAKMSWYAIYETLPNWYNELNIRDDVFDKNYPSVPTFTLQDMLEMLPLSITDRFYDEAFPQTAILKILPYGDNKWDIKYIEQKRYYPVFEIENLSDLLTCAYEALCWLAENNYIENNNENK